MAQEEHPGSYYVRFLWWVNIVWAPGPAQESGLQATQVSGLPSRALPLTVLPPTCHHSCCRPCLPYHPCSIGSRGRAVLGLCSCYLSPPSACSAPCPSGSPPPPRPYHPLPLAMLPLLIPLSRLSFAQAIPPYSLWGPALSPQALLTIPVPFSVLNLWPAFPLCLEAPNPLSPSSALLEPGDVGPVPLR